MTSFVVQLQSVGCHGKWNSQRKVIRLFFFSIDSTMVHSQYKLSATLVALFLALLATLAFSFRQRKKTMATDYFRSSGPTGCVCAKRGNLQSETPYSSSPLYSFGWCCFFILASTHLGRTWDSLFCAHFLDQHRTSAGVCLQNYLPYLTRFPLSACWFVQRTFGHKPVIGFRQQSPRASNFTCFFFTSLYKRPFATR